MPFRSWPHVMGMIVLVSGLNCLCASQAQAQLKQGPRQQIRQSFRDRPTVSPYTALLNNGAGGAAMSYYNIIRPRQQASKVARSLSNQLRTVESEVKSIQETPPMMGPAEAISTGRMAPTGHATAFGNLGGYFPGAPQAR